MPKIPHHTVNTSRMPSAPYALPGSFSASALQEGQRRNLETRRRNRQKMLRGFGVGMLAGLAIDVAVAVPVLLYKSSQSVEAQSYNPVVPTMPAPNYDTESEEGFDDLHAFGSLARQDGFDGATFEEGMGDNSPQSKENNSMSVTLLMGRCSIDNVVIHFTSDTHNTPTDITSYDLPLASFDRTARTVPVAMSADLLNTRYSDCLNFV
ncbi:MAG: hypothetical protein WAS36_02380 [Candidatus Saccharimonadales bacterium]